MSDELKELKKISKILTLANAELLEKTIADYASTNERKMIWVLIDGVRFPKDMASEIGNIKVRAIEIFLEELEKAQLIENPKRKAAEKLIEYVPPSWITLLEENKKQTKNKPRKRATKLKK
ncbi:MAG: hypothetical protein NWF05_05605 [Candidatus Bathyarchaeota archaeon]|nr:hypothetical protein [Candidatus Bathyarchaeota archaeon]